MTSLKSNLYKSLTTQNAAEKNYILSRPKHSPKLQPTVIFNRNTSVTAHEQRTVDFPQRKQLPRSTADISVSISSLLCELTSAVLVQTFLWALRLHAEGEFWTIKSTHKLQRGVNQSPGE